MALRLYNTLTRKKEPFRPLDPSNVRMYVCGPTVYDFAHIGNARPVIVFDVLFRLLRHLYGPEHVTYVRNITDVDDKINARAAQDYPGLMLNEAIRKVTEKTEAQFHADVAALGCLPPTVEPRATEHIAAMAAMIEMLVERGAAYVAEDHVLFHVAAMADYGKLSGRSLDEMIAGARVEVAPFKRDPMDFVLWKPSKPGEPSWPSPAGIKTQGRPGWHIECSAMAWKHLGETFDIHGGGIDLVFPHHENEIAQSRSAFQTQVMANTWLHNGFLQVEGEKMAKSLGNFVTIRKLLDSNWRGQEIRLAMLATHYRQPINWTMKGLLEARKVWRDFVFAAQDVHPSEVPSRLIAALEDDLNTPEAVSYLHQLKKDSNAGSLEAARALRAGLEFMGLLPSNYAWEGFGGVLQTTAEPAAMFDDLLSRSNGDAFVRRIFSDLELVARERGYPVDPEVFSVASKISPSIQVRDLRERNIRPVQVDTLITARNAARKAKDFAEADRIRAELEAMGIELQDAKDPKTGELITTWEVAR